MYIRALLADPSVEIKFVAGQNFQSHVGFHEIGDIIEDAAEWPNLEVLVNTRFLYPYVGDQEYDRLPAYVYSMVMTKAEIDAELDKETGPRGAVAAVEALRAREPKKSAAAEVAEMKTEEEAPQKPAAKKAATKKA